ncbi:MAG: hypothetical protein NTV05_09795 [Acidobacteria bacterium]|nr:hypothetical protein [Acidobacteriota bacterium]
MSTGFQYFESVVLAALDATPSRIPVVVGPCGAGRTSLLRRVGDRVGKPRCQYVALDRVVSTPERFLAELSAASPFAWARPGASTASPREAFDRVSLCLTGARSPNEAPATWLLDEFLELKTLESFPGLRRVVPEAVEALAASDNRFVLTSRFVARTLRTLREAPERFVVLHVPPLATADVAADLLRIPGFRSDTAEDAGRVIVALTGGRLAYAADVVRALGDPTLRVRDPISAFAALLSPGGAICARCRNSYEFRLHRARGYGALKAILGILSEDEPVTLTTVATRMQRTPGSTKDYLGWLEDVDLVVSHRKRYSFADPVLRLWVRLHTHCDAPDDTRVADLVQRYAAARLSTAPEST